MSEQISLRIGSEFFDQSGHCHDDWRSVEFEGERLAELERYVGSDSTRGTTETLYRASDGRLIVHRYDWSRWQGEPDTERLFQVTEDDLRPGGRFEQLGAEAGFGRPLTLDEALTPAYHDDTQEITA